MIRKPLRILQQWNRYRRYQTDVIDDRVVSAFIDFEYQHYALGDIITKIVYLSCLAQENDCTAIDIYIVIDPSRPSAPAQGFINPENYITHLTNLLPAFLCTPKLRSIQILRDGGLSASFYRKAAQRKGGLVWPDFESQVRKKIAYPLSHGEINAFHARHGHLPLLDAPRGYDGWARAFADRYLTGKFVTCINPRQSRLTNSPATIYRDADLDDWYEFIARAERELPRVAFVQLGGHQEWDRRLSKFSNVTIPRAYGLGLAHELALLRHADLFMGTSSGFATMATFTDVPYLICDVEHFFADYAEVAVGTPHYPFAHAGQTLLWEKETPDLLFAHLESALDQPRPDAIGVATKAEDGVSAASTDGHASP